MMCRAKIRICQGVRNASTYLSRYLWWHGIAACIWKGFRAMGRAAATSCMAQRVARHCVCLALPMQAQLLPIVLPALEENTSSHWNPAVHGLTVNVRKMFQVRYLLARLWGFAARIACSACSRYSYSCKRRVGLFSY